MERVDERAQFGIHLILPPDASAAAAAAADVRHGSASSCHRIRWPTAGQSGAKRRRAGHGLDAPPPSGPRLGRGGEGWVRGGVSAVEAAAGRRGWEGARGERGKREIGLGGVGGPAGLFVGWLFFSISSPSAMF